MSLDDYPSTTLNLVGCNFRELTEVIQPLLVPTGTDLDRLSAECYHVTFLTRDRYLVALDGSNGPASLSATLTDEGSSRDDALVRFDHDGARWNLFRAEDVEEFRIMSDDLNEVLTITRSASNTDLWDLEIKVEITDGKFSIEPGDSTFAAAWYELYTRLHGTFEVVGTGRHAA